jgi:hypothetical protein
MALKRGEVYTVLTDSESFGPGPLQAGDAGEQGCSCCGCSGEADCCGKKGASA